MSHRPSSRRRSLHSRHELDIIPILNVFMIIVPFLLLTAVFAKTAIIDIYLPKENQEEPEDINDKPPEILTIEITANGFELGGIGDGVIITGTKDNLNYKQLTIELVKIKDKHPQKEEVVLLFDPNTSYDTVVKVMDATRETTEGTKRLLFPFVSLGEIEES